MNLEKVHYLLTAIECGTFSLAAEKLGMTQSGLNRQISSLETELKNNASPQRPPRRGAGQRR